MLFPEVLWTSVKSYILPSGFILNEGDDRLFKSAFGSKDWNVEAVQRFLGTKITSQKGRDRFHALCAQPYLSKHLPADPGPLFWRDEFGPESIRNWFTILEPKDESWRNLGFVVNDVLISDRSKVEVWFSLPQVKLSQRRILTNEALQSFVPDQSRHQDAYFNFIQIIQQFQRSWEIGFLFEIAEFHIHQFFSSALYTLLLQKRFEISRLILQSGIFSQHDLYRIYQRFAQHPRWRPQCREMAVHLPPQLWMDDELDGWNDWDMSQTHSYDG